MARIDEIKAGMARKLEGKASVDDLSYVTEELLAKHKEHATEYDPKEKVHALYQGNHLIDNKGYWTWENSPNDICGRTQYRYWNSRRADTYGIEGNCSAGYWYYNINIV